MAKLAYCETCKATYPLVIVTSDGGRSGKVKEPACPMGHTNVREIVVTQKRATVKKAAAPKVAAAKATPPKVAAPKAAPAKAAAKKPVAAKVAAKKPASKKTSDKKA